jgi:hypothetical protein
MLFVFRGTRIGTKCSDPFSKRLEWYLTLPWKVDVSCFCAAIDYPHLLLLAGAIIQSIPHRAYCMVCKLICCNHNASLRTEWGNYLFMLGICYGLIDNRRAAKNNILTMTTVFSLFRTTLTCDSLLVIISALERATPNWGVSHKFLSGNAR